MSMLNRYVTSRVSNPFFVIAFIAALLANASVSWAQSKSSSIEVSDAAAQSVVNRLGVTLGGEAWVDVGPLSKNLVLNNPGFEAADYRAILRCGALTADGCRVADAATEADGLWSGAHYQVMSGSAAGATGTVVSHTSGGGGSVLALDKSQSLSAGDYFSVEVLKPVSGVAGWASISNGGGTISAETADLSPETSGKQALLLSALGRGGSVRLSQELDAQPGLSKLQLNGAYEVSFRAKGIGGNNQLNVSVAREVSGNATYLNRPVTLTDNWAQYTLSFSAAETGTQSSPLQLSFAAAGAGIELDDVSLQQSNSDSANVTAFRDEVVNALQELHPGTIRMVSGGSDVLTQLASPFARYGQGLSTDVTSAPKTAYGIQEFLELCTTVGADPWITVPTSTTPREMTDLVQYLTGDGSDTWSALRIARGHAEPWTSVFGKVHIELENSTGIGGSASEPMASSAYASWSNAVFGAARRNTGYSAAKFDLLLSGSAAIPPVLPTPVSSPAAETLTTPSATTSAQVINCSSGFASSGGCGVAVTGSGGQPFQFTNDQSAGVVVGTQALLIPRGSGHVGSGLIYQTAVNVQAFSTTFTFVPNGWNFALVLQNNTNPNGGGGGHPWAFAGGAGCEGGFYQAFGTAPTSANNIFALELDQQSALTNSNIVTAPFTYSGVQIYQANQSPCNPNDGGPDYTFIPKISTSPVPLNSPVNTRGTTTGDTYSVTLGYNGTMLNMSMYDVTAGGSCPGTKCFTQSWTVNIPSLVGGNTAYVGFTGSTNENSTHPLYVNSFVYNVGASPAAATPTFSVPAGTYSTVQTVSISDSTPGATIYYTTNGTTPTTSSSVYSGPVTVSSTETLRAIAAASGYTNSSVASATYAINATPAMPRFSVAAGTYTSTQKVSISDATAGTTIYYTRNGTTPTTSSTEYTGAITVNSTETLEAVATVGDPTMSAVARATYVIEAPDINYPSGRFKASSFDLNGGAAITSGGLLQLTSGGGDEGRSAWFATKVPVQTFTTDFTFQLTDAQADGFAFVIQNAGPAALGADGGGLGYLGIPQSVALKFDLFNNAGEGPDSTGLYTDGAAPIVPAINLSGTPINLHSGDSFAAHITYDGTDLTLTLTDSSTLGTWSHSWPINIPATVGGNTAYVGFTGGTGALTATQDINAWTYLPALSTPNYPAGFDGAGLHLNGATYSRTWLHLASGGFDQAGSAFYATPVNIAAFTTYFSFQFVEAQADGFTFVIQNVGPTALGADGGGLGYRGIPQSVAIKFDLFDNAGEGPDSTGLYTDGAMPTVPAINLTGTPINLHSGDEFAAQISYNGTDLALSLTDSNTLGRWSYSWPINIPATVGGTTAYVGFTGGTGGLTSTQNMLSWTFF